MRRIVFSLTPSTVTASAILFLFNVIETKFLRASSTSEFSHSLDPTRTWPGNFAVTHKTLPFGDVLECLLDLREDL